MWYCLCTIATRVQVRAIADALKALLAAMAGRADSGSWLATNAPAVASRLAAMATELTTARGAAVRVKLTEIIRELTTELGTDEHRCALYI